MGRATRTVKITDTLQGEMPEMNTAALNTEGEKQQIGEEEKKDMPENNLFNPDMIGHVVTLWILTPTISARASFTVFMIMSLF